MSRIGKQPIEIPPKVKVEVKGQQVFVEGPKGKLNWELPRRTSLKVDGGKVVVSRQGDDAQAKALHGLSRALVNNMVRGVSDGFVKKLTVRNPSCSRFTFHVSRFTHHASRITRLPISHPSSPVTRHPPHENRTETATGRAPPLARAQENQRHQRTSANERLLYQPEHP